MFPTGQSWKVFPKILANRYKFSWILKQLHISKLNYVMYCSFFHTIQDLTEKPGSQHRHWETLWKVVIYSSVFLSSFSSRRFRFLYYCRPILPGHSSQGVKVKMKHFLSQWSWSILKHWTFFFFPHWQVKMPLPKLNSFGVFTLLCHLSI